MAKDYILPRFLFIVVLFLSIIPSQQAIAAVYDPLAIQRPIFDKERLKLSADYALHHYGEASSFLNSPTMIIVHFTTISTLQKSLDFFLPARLDQKIRRDISGGGEVNVSTHYLVDRDGTLYQMAAEDVLCRHIIGFNHSAIGIENVAADAGQLTVAQVEANAALIGRMIQRHPSISYLLGHHEYRDRSLPHYRLLHEADPVYRFTDKVDPGPYFMAQLRDLLDKRYDIRLQK